MVGLTTKKSFLPHLEGAAQRASFFLIVTTLCGCALGNAQVFVVQREHLGSKDANLTTVQPTNVVLESKPISERTKQQLVRTFQADEAFAVRPLPLGTKGIVLHANGPLSPSGSGYADELEKYGISAKPGDRVVITRFEVRPDRIIFEFNNGPEKHHHLLQHIEVGGMGGMAPLAQDDGQVPVGARMTLVFEKFVPEMEAYQLRKLIAPMIDFSLKSPAEAFADTLPPKLKGAVLNHEVLVGMNREMVLKAVGQPDQKVRETDGQTPFEEWIYGTPPHEVQFVRFNGNRVIRLEIADIGQPPIIRDKDETDGYFAGQFVHQVRLGDAPPAPSNQEHAPTKAPSLRQPGEDLPNAVDKDHQMKPVQYPDDQKPQPIPPPPGSAPASQLVNVSGVRGPN
ncbi:MAG: hypothetical protein WA510_25340 [Acidobacteriaceae bacterium]